MVSQSQSDSVLGLASVIEAMVIRGLVLSKGNAPAKRSMEVMPMAIGTPAENPSGRMGLKTHATATKAATHAYLRSFTACTNTNTAPAAITKSK